MIIDGGTCLVGIESTVVRVENDKIIITRPGFITKEDLQDLFGNKFEVIYGQKPSLVTPGNRYKHYSPDADISIFDSLEDLLSKIKYCEEERFGIIATKEFIQKNKNLIIYPGIKTFELGSESNLLTCVHNLFSVYHKCDKEGLKNIFIQSLPEEGIGYALMNRIKKSAQN